MNIADKKQYNRMVNEYNKQLKKMILTTRFNDETWKENEKYRIQENFKGCVYSSPEQISMKIPQEKILFVLEMNNNINKIMGIGMIRNEAKMYKYHMYDNERYNRYQYIGNHRIDRSDMDKTEELIMLLFDKLCFKGNCHMKRGQGLKSFPIKMLYNCSKVVDLVEFINNMFKKRLC